MKMKMPATMSYRRKKSEVTGPMMEINPDSGQLYVKFARANVLSCFLDVCTGVQKMIELISTDPTTTALFV